MTRFNISGSFLELPANFKIQLKKRNILFAFDNVELERSTSFSVPATPINTGILGWANDAHRFGEKGRQKIAAQLQLDGVTKDGFLHITKYTPEAFECVFVTGELLGLTEVKALGDWGQFILPSNGVSMDAAVRIASSGNDYSAARVDYKTDGYIMPSWKLSSYAQMALQRAAVDVNWGEVLDGLNTYRIIIPKAKGVSETAVTFTRRYSAGQTSATPYPVLNSALLDDQGELSNVVTIEQSAYPIFKVKTTDATQYYGYVMQFVAKQDMTLKFADDTPDTLFVASAQMNGTFDFLGGYSFAADGTITGDPLKGREVEIATDQAFLLISQNDYLRAGTGEFEGWTIANEELTANVVVKGKDEQPNNAYIRVKDNLPAMTIVELVKVIAALSGKILSYQAGEIVFVDNIAGGEYMELDKPLKWSNLTRGVGDYAQKNLVTFKDGELTAIYTIDNVNIEQEKELLAIPMNAGADVAGELFVAGDTEEYTIARYDETRPINLQRIEVMKNESLEKILFRSTSLTAEVKMTEREFDKLPFDAQLRFDNALYAWTDGVWSNGVASMNLSKLKGEYTPPPPPYIPHAYQQVEYLYSSKSDYAIYEKTGNDSDWEGGNARYPLKGRVEFETQGFMPICSIGLVKFIAGTALNDDLQCVGLNDGGYSLFSYAPLFGTYLASVFMPYAIDNPSTLIIDYYGNSVGGYAKTKVRRADGTYRLINLSGCNVEKAVEEVVLNNVRFYSNDSSVNIAISAFRKGGVRGLKVFDENGDLYEHIVPAYRKSDMAVGFYYLRNGVFSAFTKQGLVVGPDVNT